MNVGRVRQLWKIATVLLENVLFFLAWGTDPLSFVDQWPMGGSERENPWRAIQKTEKYLLYLVVKIQGLKQNMIQMFII